MHPATICFLFELKEERQTPKRRRQININIKRQRRGVKDTDTTNYTDRDSLSR